MNLQKRHDPALLLREAVGDLRTIGTVFCVVGVFPIVLTFVSRRRPAFIEHVMVAIDSLLLIGPGAWYIVAAILLKRLQFSMIRTTLYVAAAQVVVVLGILGLAILLQLGSLAALIIPAALVVFFIPAVLATIWHVRRLKEMAHLLLPMGMAFEPVKVQAIPEATVQPLDGGPDGPASQG